MVTAGPVTLERARIRELTDSETRRFNNRTSKSGEMF